VPSRYPSPHIGRSCRGVDELVKAHVDYYIYETLADLQNDEEGCSWPSLAYLAKRSRLDKKTVLRAIQRLVRLGLVEILTQGGWDGKKNAANRYKVHLPQLREGGSGATPPPPESEGSSGTTPPRGVEPRHYG
jgi:hypothetical protein